jgi:chitinase
MNIRSLFSRAPALVTVLLLAACGGGNSDGSPISSGSISEGGSEGVVSSGSSSGATTSGADAAVGGAATDGGTRGAPAEASGPITAEAGGPITADAGVVSDSGLGDGSAATDGMATPTTKVVMYLPNWSGTFASWATKIDFNKMTHLLLAFGVVNAGTNTWNLGAADADVGTLAAAAHAKNVKVLVSIGGASDDIGIITRYQTASNIDPLVADLDAMVTRLNLDGVDVDLERGADMKSSGNFPAFVNKLISTFRPKGELVTAALAQYIIQAAGTDAALLSVLSSFDFINLMIYSTNMSSYTSELNWWTTTTGVPRNKLTWGIQFTNNLSAATATQLTTASKSYGGVMVWEYSQTSEPRLWPAIQSAL